MHLLHTHNYWDDFCQRVLGTPLHHTPSLGGRQEGKSISMFINKPYLPTVSTLEIRQQIFGTYRD